MAKTLTARSVGARERESRVQSNKESIVAEEDFRHLGQKISGCQNIWTQVWHGGESEIPPDPLLALAQQQHRKNFDLWHEEDKARAPEVADSQIATVKRAIDKLNQQRNDLIEKLDEFIWGQLQLRKIEPRKDAAWNSETPGSVIDRLSIISLKVFHMREQTERLDATKDHLAKCKDRLAVLLRQQEDLATALQRLLNDLFSGEKEMKIYRQFKMYNDPSLNPAIYGAKKV